MAVRSVRLLLCPVAAFTSIYWQTFWPKWRSCHRQMLETAMLRESASVTSVKRALSKMKTACCSISSSAPKLRVRLYFFGNALKFYRTADGSFLTEEDASRKSIYRYLNKLSLGSYKLGIHEGHVLVQDRLTGKIVEEKIPFYLKMILKLLYRHGRPIVGRVMKKVFSTLTCKHGHKYDLPSSAKKIEGFVRYHQIKMGDFVVPQNGGYRTFNEFFYRKLKPGARRLQVDPAVCSDAYVLCVCFLFLGFNRVDFCVRSRRLPNRLFRRHN